MEAPNIQLYNLFRQDLRLTDGKSLELMHLLDKEYKSGVKEDIAALGKLLDARFEKIDAHFEKIDTRFQAIDDRLSAHDKRFDALDSKIDKSYVALDSKIDKSYDALDNKIDKSYVALDSKIAIKAAELRTEIHKSRTTIIIWVGSVILSIFALIIAWFRK
ncbi:MAG TPA: hypothetical protein VGS79_08635 [Puia sp.]|nr:hypothetical protein [Puia sp.]